MKSYKVVGFISNRPRAVCPIKLKRTVEASSVDDAIREWVAAAKSQYAVYDFSVLFVNEV